VALHILLDSAAPNFVTFQTVHASFMGFSGQKWLENLMDTACSKVKFCCFTARNSLKTHLVAHWRGAGKECAMKHLATLSLAVCGLSAVQASERLNAAPSGCENVQAAAAASAQAAQAQRFARTLPQAPGGLVTHGGGQVIHNAGQVVHRGGNVVHNGGQVTHNTPLLNRREPNYGMTNALPPCVPGG
jgi:hypothetical protein